METIVKKTISELFGDAPSIGDKKRVSFDLSLSGEYMILSVDGFDVMKMNEDGSDIKKHPDYDRIVTDIRSENMFLFRASGIGNIITESRGKSNMQRYIDAKNSLQQKIDRLNTLSEAAVKTREKLKTEIDILRKDVELLEKVKDVFNISETSKKEVQKIVNETVWGRKKVIRTKQMEKGTDQEVESILLLSEFDGFAYIKNTDRQIDTELRLSGELDIKRAHDDGTVEIIDIKTRWDIDSFFNQGEEQNKGEADQLDAYLLLNPDANKATIANILTNNSDDAIRRMVYLESLSYENGEMPKSEQIRVIGSQVFDEKNFKRLVWEIVGDIQTDFEAIEEYEAFREIPLNKRVHKITRERDESRLDSMRTMLINTLEWTKSNHNIF